MFKILFGLLIAISPFQSLHADKPNWEPYLEDSKNETEPGIGLVKAVEEWTKRNPEKKGMAIDLGAGTGRDTLYLLKKGWEVLAIDIEEKAIEILKSRVPDDQAAQLVTQVASFEAMELPLSADLVNARNALSYCDPARFPGTWEQIVDSIAPGGYFSGTFFGDRAIPVSIPHEFSLNKQQLLNLFKDRFEIIFFDEQDTIGKGWRWHMFYVTARKVN